MTYVLIIFFMTTSGASVTTHEFSNLVTCELAAKSIRLDKMTMAVNASCHKL